MGKANMRLITPLLNHLLQYAPRNDLIGASLTILSTIPSPIRELTRNNQQLALHRWKIIALRGVNGPVDHFKSHPHRRAMGLRHLSRTYTSLLLQWKTFIIWFNEFTNLGVGLLVFPSPLLSKYSTLMTLGSTPLPILEWGMLNDITLFNSRRHSSIFRYFARYASNWKLNLCAFPDIIAHHATVSNIIGGSIFSVGLVPMSHLTHKLTFSLHVFDLSYEIQLMFLNLMRYLYSL